MFHLFCAKACEAQCPYTRFAGQKNILYNGKERGNKHDSKSTKTHSTASL